jgi:hypothetical protein
MDPTYPAARIAFVLEEAKVAVLLSQKRLATLLPPSAARVVQLDGEWDTILHALDVSESNIPVCSQDLAYVIYTSGSTGKPKGVEIPHRAVVNLLCSMRKKPGIEPTDVLLAVTTLSFDIAALELFLPLCVGAKVVIASREAARKPMPVPAHHIMVATWNDKIYVFGGFVRPPSIVAWQPIDRAWEYDPATDNWRELAPMPTPRGAGQAVEVGGKIYVIGGARSNKPGEAGAPIPPGSIDQLVVGTVEEYDPATNQWRARSPMPTARNHFFAGAVDGKIYAVDGRIGTVFVTKSDTIDLVESYDPVTDHWAFASRAPTTRGDVTGD